MVELARGHQPEVTADVLRAESNIWPLPRLEALTVLGRAEGGKNWSKYSRFAGFLVRCSLVGTKIQGGRHGRLMFSPEDLVAISVATEAGSNRPTNEIAMKVILERKLLKGKKLKKAREIYARYSR